MLSRFGGALAASPGAGARETIIGRGGGPRRGRGCQGLPTRGSATTGPVTSPPFQAGVKAGVSETPMSATKPGPSAPVRHSARERGPPLPDALSPPVLRQLVTPRQKAVAVRYRSLSSATPTSGSAIGGSFELCS